MEKFTNYPQSYGYLLDHRDEFVQSPDPVNDRAAFDRWFKDKLILALGPLSERIVNLDNVGGGGGTEIWEVLNNDTNKGAIKLSSNPPFFWFTHDGIVYPVPCITTENSVNRKFNSSQ